jgi:prepilin-type N-terminal cleavage/methylation domain-containing protein
MNQNFLKKSTLRLSSLKAWVCSGLTMSEASLSGLKGRAFAGSNRSKGVTLIELLIALLISAIIIAGIYRTFIHQQKTYATQEQVADMQQNVRVAINRMMREIRMAGFGNVQGVLPVTFPGVGRTYPDVINPDLPVVGAFTIVSAIGGNATLLKQPGDSVGAVVLASNQIQVSSLAEFDTNDRRYISIGGLESHFITAIDGANNILTLNTDVGNFYNTNGSTLVYAIRAISYRIIINASGRSILRRDENIGGGFQPVADNIEAIEFRNPDGSIPVNPNSMSLQVAVTAMTDRPDPELLKGGGDGYRRRQYTSIILQRNRGL